MSFLSFHKIMFLFHFSFAIHPSIISIHPSIHPSITSQLLFISVSFILSIHILTFNYLFIIFHSSIYPFIVFIHPSISTSSFSFATFPSIFHPILLLCHPLFSSSILSVYFSYPSIFLSSSSIHHSLFSAYTCHQKTYFTKKWIFFSHLITSINFFSSN